MQLVSDYDRAVREAHMAYSDVARAAASTRRNILANLIINDTRIDPILRVRIATAQCEALGNDSPMLAFKAMAA